ncbi:MAG TPA: SurA N-terminal domain-containing protein [Candidatus Saccharimonadales bacterium]|nr:SurA N-terminal domain-containing protein [Candidatus Saccharimonadales bacterium]
MKKPKKLLPKPKLPHPTKLPAAVKRTIKRTKPTEERVSEALENVPRITNETVAEHREDVLSSARKYIYPLQHSKHRVVRISVSLAIVVILGFLVYSGLSLYRFQATSGFMYDVTRVIPFPVAKVGSNWVSYESYLFELRRNMHYYVTQQQTDFSTKDGKQLLTRLKQQALNQSIQQAYVKQLAAKNHVSVSPQAVDQEVALVRSQNRLGNSDQVFRNVLNQYWGWNEADFKRELQSQLLQQAVVAKLDTTTQTRAQTALKQLKQGVSFMKVAERYSDDTATQARGGQYTGAITQNDPEVPPQITAALFQLKTHQVSTLINTGYTLEILRVLSVNAGNGSRTAAHIQFTFQPVTTYIEPLQKQEPAHRYMTP